MNPQPTTSDKSSHQGTGAIKDLERGTNVSKAVRLLYKLYSERLRYLGWKLCGSDADEVVDEAFIYGVKAIQTGMFRSPDGRRPSKAFLGFLRSLLKNKAISWLRKKTADKRPQERNRVPLDVIQTEAERPGSPNRLQGLPGVPPEIAPRRRPSARNRRAVAGRRA